MRRCLRGLGLLVALSVAAVVWPARCEEQTKEAPPKKLPFEDEIRKYEEADKKAPPPKGAVLFVGSSSIRMWRTVEKDMAPLPALNRGFGGSKAADVLPFVDRIVTPYAPKAIVYYEGDNDIVSGKKPEQVRDDVAKFVDAVRKALPDVPIYVIAVKPSPSRVKHWPAYQELNKLLQEYAKAAKGVTYVDVATEMLKDGQPRPELFLKDMLHMNADGYAIWTKTVRAALGVKDDAAKP